MESEIVFKVVACEGVKYRAVLITNVEVWSPRRLRREPNKVVPVELPRVTLDTVTEVEGKVTPKALLIVEARADWKVEMEPDTKEEVAVPDTPETVSW